MSAPSESPAPPPAFADPAFPTQQSVIMPGAGTGKIGLFLAGLGPTLYIHFAGETAAQVWYGQNGSEPNTPLTQGTSTFPNTPGFNMRWSSPNGILKLVWAAGD